MSDGTFDPKDPSESRAFVLDFADDLAAGETVTAATFTVTVLEGTDANPSAMLSGAAVASGTTAAQRLVGGLAGVVYKVRAVVTTSASNTLVGCGTLLVQAC